MRRSAPPARKSPSCLSRLGLLAVVVLLHLVGAYFLVGRSVVGDYVGQRVGKQMGVGELPGVEQISQAELESQMEQTLPTAIAALPRGELTVSEERINSYIAANPAAFEPLEAVRVRFVPGQVQANITAFGTSNQATFGLELAGGEVMVVNPQLNGPLGWLLSFEDLVQSLEQQINEQFDTQGRAITDIRVEQGKLVALVE